MCVCPTLGIVKISSCDVFTQTLTNDSNIKKSVYLFTLFSLDPKELTYKTPRQLLVPLT